MNWARFYIDNGNRTKPRPASKSVVSKAAKLKSPAKPKRGRKVPS